MNIGYFPKSWGHEYTFASTDNYSGKIMKFNKDGKFSMHFHTEKDETWYILEGKFIVKFIDTKNATEHEIKLNPNDVWRNKPLFPHQLICIEEGTIIEVSSPVMKSDIHRISRGDVQN